MRLLGLLLLAGMALLSYRQSLAWQSEESLWSQAASVSGKMPRPHINLGLEYQKQGRIRESIREFETAVSLSYDSRRMASHQRLSRSAAQSNLALMLLMDGRFSDSLRLSTLVLQESPDFGSALVNRGTAYLALGDCTSARTDYLAAGILELPTCR